MSRDKWCRVYFYFAFWCYLTDKIKKNIGFWHQIDEIGIKPDQASAFVYWKSGNLVFWCLLHFHHQTTKSGEAAQSAALLPWATEPGFAGVLIRWLRNWSTWTRVWSRLRRAGFDGFRTGKFYFDPDGRHQAASPRWGKPFPRRKRKISLSVLV